MTLEEYRNLPICPKCGMTLWEQPCRRCKALTPNTEAQHTAFVLGVLTGRIVPLTPEN